MAHQLPSSRELYRLLPFVQAVRSGSFLAAAAELQLTPPAISKSIACLEAAMSVRLFNRTTRQLRLTMEGRELFDRINPLMLSIDEAIKSARNASANPQGHVRVSATPAFGRFTLIPALVKFFEEYPEISVEVSLDDEPPELVELGFDLRIQRGRGPDSSYVCRRLCPYPIALAAAPGYLARYGVPQTPADLAAHRCVVLRLAEGSVVWDLQRVELETENLLHVPQEHYLHVPKGPLVIAGQIDASLNACLHGAGISPVSEAAAAPFFAAGRLEMVLPKFRLSAVGEFDADLYVQYPHRKHLPAKVQVLLKFLYAHLNIDDSLLDLGLPEAQESNLIIGLSA
jgi:LysR family transcriptional activator of dmlA